jgi:hypothetical protein
MVVSDKEKACKTSQIGFKEMNASESLLRCRDEVMMSKPGITMGFGINTAEDPVYWRLCGIRHKDGMTLNQAIIRNVRNCMLMLREKFK